MGRPQTTEPSRLKEQILTLSCPDQKGLVFRVSEFLFEQGCNILDSAQYGDEQAGRFFMRLHFSTPDSSTFFESEFERLARPLEMEWSLFDAAAKTRVMVLVSQHGHCLNDLLFRASNKQIPIEISAVVSNHRDFEGLATHHGIEFHHLQVTPENKQEDALRELYKTTGSDLVVLARYMQILSDDLCRDWSGRAINIHHSFLPSFKGAKPYAQAYSRGVKIIGATSHYVTADLDEGPIIEQDVERVDHTLNVEELTRIGGDIESRVLARAVRWHAEHRILINGQKTIVFR
ncbi:MAG: formyltetrahydrofolate deformylase [Pseudomonadota bacterium]